MKKKALMIAIVCAVVFSTVAFAKDTTVTGVVNINTATKEEITLVPWIGEVRADEIIAMRSQKPFTQLDELLVVKGLGEKTLAKIAQYIVFKGETTIREVKQQPAAPQKTASN